MSSICQEHQEATKKFLEKLREKDKDNKSNDKDNKK